MNDYQQHPLINITFFGYQNHQWLWNKKVDLFNK